jgi:hypothetical protein
VGKEGREREREHRHRHTDIGRNIDRRKVDRHIDMHVYRVQTNANKRTHMYTQSDTKMRKEFIYIYNIAGRHTEQ